MCHWAEEEGADQWKLQAQEYEQAEPCRIFRAKLPIRFVISLVPWHPPPTHPPCTVQMYGTL